MKRQRTIRRWWWLEVMVLALASSAWAAGTPAGTIIRNQAFANYKDANGNALPQVNSNEVTTTVAQVAAVDISPATGAANILANGSSVFALTAATSAMARTR